MKIIIFFLFLITSVFSTIVVDKNFQSATDFKIRYFIDDSSTKTFEEIEKVKFIKESSNSFTLGYIGVPSWIQFDVVNTSLETKEIILEFSEAFYKSVDLYYRDNSNIIIKRNGLDVPLEKREIQSHKPIFNITLDPSERKKIYLRLHSSSGSFAEISLYNLSEYNEAKEQDIMMYMLYLGAIFTIALYNLFLYFSLRDVVYLYYFFYSFSFLMFVSMFSGYILKFIPIWLYHKTHALVACFLLFFILFSNQLLQIKRHYPKLKKFLDLNVLVLTLFAILGITVSIQPWHMFSNFIASYIVIIYLVVAILLIRKKDKIAKLYLLAILSYIFTMSMLSNMALGLLPNTEVTRYSYLLGSFLEIVLFSFTLAYKFNSLQKEKIATQKALIDAKEEYKDKLEHNIILKTEELRASNEELFQAVKSKDVLLKEVYHRVKNNFQMIIGILWLEAEAQDSSENNKLLSKINDRLKSMALVHEMLYASKDLSRIELNKYIQELLNSFMRAHGSKQVTIHTDLDSIKIDMEKAISIGLIVNEVVTNSYKYAFEEKGEIFVSLKNGDSCTLTIKDNGRGFDIQNAEPKLGQKLIESFSQKLPNATTDLKIDNGVIFTLNFSL